MSAEPLGVSVLTLTTDQTPLDKGLADARAETVRQTEAMKNAARIDLRANLLKLQSDYNQGERAARDFSQQAARQSAFDLRIRLEQYKSDLRQAENEQKSSLQRMQRQAQESGGGLSGLGGDILAGLGIGSGAAVAQQAIQAIGGIFKSTTAEVFDYNAAVQAAQNRVRGFTGDQKAVADVIALANKQLQEGRGGFLATEEALADLTPLANKYNESLSDVLHTAQLLAAADPVQGFKGATIALQEALSGNFTSLQRRFELPLSAIQALKDQGVPNLQIVQRVLDGLGINDRLLTQQAQNVSQQIAILKDNFLRLGSVVEQPIGEQTGQAIRELTGYLSSPTVQNAARDFGAALAAGLAQARAAIDDPSTREGLKALAELSLAPLVTNIGAAVDALKVLGTTLAALGPVVGVATGALNELQTEIGKVLDSTAGKDGAIRDFADSFKNFNVVPFAVTNLSNFVDQLKKLNDQIERSNQLAGKGPIGLIEQFLRDRGLGAQVDAFQAIQQAQAAQAGVGNTPAPGGGRDDRATATQTSGSPAPTTIAIPPPEEAQFDITARKDQAQRYQDLYNQGLADFKRYVAGFTSGDFDIYDKLRPQVQSSFDRLFGDLDLGQQVEHGGGDLDGLTARIVNDLKTTKNVSEETRNQLRATFGDQAQSIIDLANSYGALEIAQDRAKTAADNLKAAQLDLTAAQKQAAADQQEVRDNVEEFSRTLAALNKEAAGVAAGYAGEIDQAQQALTAAQQAQSQLQQQAQLHAAAYQAVLEGNTDEFLKQNDALDEQTRKIIENGNAQVAAALKAKTAQDDVVNGLEVKERATQLDFDTRIRAARAKRTPQGDQEANALTEQRDREIAKIEYQLQLERERAAVRGDEANAAKKPVEEAAQKQAAADQQAELAAGKRVDEASTRLSDIQKQAKAAADDYAARGQAIQDNIDKEEERGRVLARVDQKAIDDAQKRVDDATIVKQNADDELVTQGHITDALSAQNTLLDTRFTAWRKFYDEVLKPAGIIMAQFANGYPQPPPAQQGQTGTQQSPIDGSPESQPRGQSDPPPITTPGQLSRVPLPVYTPPAALSRAALPTYQPPAPPAANLAAYSALGAQAGAASAGGRGPVTVHAPITFPNAQFTSDIDVKRAMHEAASMQARTLLAALGEDDASGGSLSNWRG